MDAAVAALIGAGIGAIVPATVAIFSARGARYEAREARLFDHRREAYAAFISECQSLVERIRQHRELHSSQIAPGQWLQPIYDSAARLQLYGTHKADELAGDVFDSLLALHAEVGVEGNERLARTALTTINVFTRQARRDLGTREG